MPRPSGVWKRLFPPDTEGESDDYEPPAGVELDHFVIEQRIGYGGMGAVFRAVDQRLQRTVALKVLAPSQSRDAAAVRRFQNEACAAAQLDHDNIARVYHIGQAHGLHYIAYEYVFGTNVRDLIQQRRRLGLAEAITYTLQIAAALKHTSAAGVVHRDIKPSNIIVTPGGRTKLVDLGLARKATPESEEDLTLAGTTLGTFDYISPEQAKDPRNVDVRSDIYSLGCTLYHMLTGEPPYPEGTVLQKLLDHQGKEPPDPARQNRHVPENLSAIVQKMMASDPRQRHATAEQLYNDLVVLARSMGLQTVNPETTAWIPLARKSQFWERHLAWMATAAALLLSVFLLNQFGDEVRQVANRGSQDAGKRDAGPSASYSADPGAPGEHTLAGTERDEDALGSSTGETGPSSGDVPPGTDFSPRQEAGSLSPLKKTTGFAGGEDSGQEAGPSSQSGNSGSTETDPSNPEDGSSLPEDSSAKHTNPAAPAPVPPVPSPSPAESETDTDDSPPAEEARPGEGDDEQPHIADDQSQTTDNSATDVPGTTGASSDSETEKTAQADAEEADGDPETAPSKDGPSADGGDAETAPLDADMPDMQKPPPIAIVSAEGEGPKAFQTLEAACTEAENGDVIELHFDGVHPVKRPVTIKNKRITIRPGEDHEGDAYRPFLEFAPGEAAWDERRMITVLAGSLNLYNIDLRLVVGEQASLDEWVLFSLEDAKRIQLRNISATVVNPGARPVAVVSLRSGPGSSFDQMQMNMGQPSVRDWFEIEIARSLIRGRCNLFATRNARPGRLQVTNSVVAVGETLLTSYGDSNRDGDEDGSPIELRLDHVTCLTGKALLRMDSGDGDLPRELLPVHVVAENNILASNGQSPLVKMVGGTNPQDFRNLLAWNGEKNFYDGFRTYWSIASQAGPSGAKTMDFEDWKNAWGSREIEPHNIVVWRHGRPQSRFSELGGSDFELDEGDEFNPAVSGATDRTNAGADLEGIPRALVPGDAGDGRASGVRG